MKINERFYTNKNRAKNRLEIWPLCPLLPTRSTTTQSLHVTSHDEWVSFSQHDAILEQKEIMKIPASAKFKLSWIVLNGQLGAALCCRFSLLLLFSLHQKQVEMKYTSYIYSHNTNFVIFQPGDFFVSLSYNSFQKCFSEIVLYFKASYAFLHLNYMTIIFL